MSFYNKYKISDLELQLDSLAYVHVGIVDGT